MRNKHLEPLYSRNEHPVPSVLSVYLDVDESNEINLNRGFEKRLKDMMGSIRKTITDSAEVDRFNAATTHACDFVSVYAPHAHTLAMFFDSLDGFFWHDEFNVPVDGEVRWDREMFLQPLVAFNDEFEKYGIVLLDHANMRLFLMDMGLIKEIANEHFSQKAVQHIRGVGMDHMCSGSRVQRKADEKVRANLRRMIKDVDSLVTTEHVEHLILAGSSEITSELQGLLPKRLALRVVGSIDLSLEVAPSEVLAKASRLAEDHERKGEMVSVREVVTAAAKNGRAVAGLTHTLYAVNRRRVWQLIYAAGYRVAGFECAKCSALGTLHVESCVYCGGALRPVQDVVERAVEHTIRYGAKIEVVRGEAADTLNQNGGIAAFLKARTASMQA